MPPKKKQPIPPPPPVNTVAEEFEARVKDATPMVDLTVAFTPVLPLRTGSHPAANVPVTVKQDGKGGYLLQWNTGPSEKVTADQLRPMRARYILRHNDYYLKLPTMGPRERDRILETFFNGKAVYLIGGLELQAKQEMEQAEKGEFSGPVKPILTIKIDPEGGEQAKEDALKQALGALGPVVELKSTRVLRQEMGRRPLEFRDVMDDAPASQIGDLGKEFMRLMKEARNAPPPPPNAWKRRGGCEEREEGPYLIQVWPAGTWGITADGKTVAHGDGGKPSALRALHQLLDDSEDHDDSVNLAD